MCNHINSTQCNSIRHDRWLLMLDLLSKFLLLEFYCHASVLLTGFAMAEYPFGSPYSHKDWRARLRAAILMLDLKLVLQHHKISLPVLELHFFLWSYAKRIERVVTRNDFLLREHSYPSQCAHDPIILFGIRRYGFGCNRLLQVILRWGRCYQYFLGSFFQVIGSFKKLCSSSLKHSRRDIAGRDHILFVSDSRFDNGGMKCIKY